MKALGVKTEFLYMTSIDRSHLESIAESPLLHNEGLAGKLIKSIFKKMMLATIYGHKIQPD